MELPSLEDVVVAGSILAASAGAAGCGISSTDAYNLNDYHVRKDLGLNVTVCPPTHVAVTDMDCSEPITGCLDKSVLPQTSCDTQCADPQAITPALACNGVRGKVGLVFSYIGGKPEPGAPGFPEWKCFPEPAKKSIPEPIDNPALDVY